MMVSLAPAHDPHLLEAYQNANRELRIRHAKVGCVLALVLVPAGSSLDYFVYPELLWPIFQIRLLCDLALLPIFALLYTSFGRRHVWTLGTLWALLPTFAICWMIYASEGVASPYYAGLNLMIIVTLQLIPYTLWEAILFCTLVIGSYVVACVLHWSSGGLLQEAPAAEFSTLYNNLYFLALTSIISITACYYSSLRRWEDFKLRHQLDVRNRELNESYDRLAELDRLKSDFFANISHELRTPLTLIVSPIDDLLRRSSNLPPDLRQALEFARQNGLRLLKLINDLLELVRLDQRKADLKREALDLSVFASGLVDSVRHLASLKGLSLKTSSVDGPIPVEVDPARMEKVVLNILTNAIKFTPNGGLIEVRCSRQGREAVLEIRDTGPGIAATDLPHIFDRFRQADSSSTRRFQGAGIGLALAHEIVQEHGGRLAASSELGAGTTLRVVLPISMVQSERLLRRGEEEVESDPIAKIYQDAERAIILDLQADARRPVPGSDAAACTVLVVDDEPDMRRFITSTLSQEHVVLEAADGESALEAVRKYRPRLIVLDLMMPKIDGLGVCRQIKSDPFTACTKIILLTAKADEASKVTALELGADDFLTKPFSTLELKTRVANLMLAEGLERDLRNRNEALERTLRQLQETEVQLIQSEKMNALGKLAAGLLHEINNPLNFTFVALQMAEASPKADEELKEIFKDIEDGMSRIRNVVSDLRAFAYPSHQARQERFTIGEALTTALRLTAQELKDLAVYRDGLDGLAACGCKAQIVHVLMNLLVNSAHATAGTGRKRQIRVEAELREGRLQVSVWDNGCGVKAEHLSRIFEPFFTTKDVGQGMGMGLSVCHTIIRNHGGTITVQSEEGKWTRFTFDLSPAEQEGTHESGVRLQTVCDPLRG